MPRALAPLFVGVSPMQAMTPSHPCPTDVRTLFVGILPNYTIFYILKATKGGEVKRKDVLKKLADAGFTFAEGTNHTKAYDSNGVYKTAIPRHTEISELTAKAIARQTGVKLQ